MLALHTMSGCCRPAVDAGASSASGPAIETIPEDEPDDDVAPTPEQLEVGLATQAVLCSRQTCNTPALIPCLSDQS